MVRLVFDARSDSSGKFGSSTQAARAGGQSTRRVHGGILRLSAVLVGAVTVLSSAISAEPIDRRTSLSELVAPGAWQEPVLAPDACPTFSWTVSPAAGPAELVVYRLGDQDRSPQTLALSSRVPAGATSWTPSGDQCLGAGMYAWTVRGERGDQWAEPLLFRIREAPSADEVQEALDVLRSYLESKGVAGGLPELEEVEAAAAGTVAPQPSRGLAVGRGGAEQQLLSEEKGEDALLAVPPSGIVAEIGSATADTAALRGIASSPTGFVYGVWGQTSSPGGRGVAGWSYAASGDAFGLHGRNTSPDGAAVFGWTTAGTGPAYGVEAITSSSSGTAVIGTAIAGSGTTTGVRGVSSSPNGIGGLFTNTAGGWLLAANDEPSAAGVEFYVEADGDVYLSGDLRCSGCIDSSDLGFEEVGTLALSDAAVTNDKLATNAVRGAEIATIVNVLVECNGNCGGITLGQVCDVIGAGYEPLFVDCHDVADFLGAPTCGAGQCLPFDVKSTSTVNLFCDDVNGNDANVYCIATN